MAEKSFWSDKKDLKWLSNFWFYYKKVVFAGIAVLLFVIYGCVSCARTIDYDLEMYYFGSKQLSSDVFDNTAAEFRELADDADGKAGVNAICLNLAIVDESEATSEVDLVMNSKVHIEIAEGDGYLYIMNDDIYGYCMEAELLEDISKYTGDKSAVYCVEITNNNIMKSLGYTTGEKLYMGVRVLNNNRIGKEIYEKKHNNAMKVIEYICKNRN